MLLKFGNSNDFSGNLLQAEILYKTYHLILCSHSASGVIFNGWYIEGNVEKTLISWYFSSLIIFHFLALSLPIRFDLLYFLTGRGECSVVQEKVTSVRPKWLN